MRREAATSILHAVLQNPSTEKYLFTIKGSEAALALVESGALHYHRISAGYYRYRIMQWFPIKGSGAEATFASVESAVLR